jgi:hypothetical protein
MCVDNIKMDLREIGWGGMDWTDLALDRTKRMVIFNMATNLSGSIKYWEILE